MKKTILSLLTFICLTMQVRAENVNVLVIHLTSGQQVVCMLSDEPRVTYADGVFVIASINEEMHYALDDVRKWTFGEIEPTAAGTASQSLVTVKINGGQLMCSGLPTLSLVSVCSLDGKSVSSVQADASGCAVVSLPTKGQVYVVSTAVASFKVIYR